MIKSKIKRRLRKKYHLGEFQELGFEIIIEFASDLNEKVFDKFYNDFIEEIEKNRLLFGGGSDKKNIDGFITSDKKHSSITEWQKEQIKDWLESRLEFKDVKVSDFKDAWRDQDC